MVHCTQFYHRFTHCPNFIGISFVANFSKSGHTFSAVTVKVEISRVAVKACPSILFANEIVLLPQSVHHRHRSQVNTRPLKDIISV